MWLRSCPVVILWGVVVSVVTSPPIVPLSPSRLSGVRRHMLCPNEGVV